MNKRLCDTSTCTGAHKHTLNRKYICAQCTNNITWFTYCASNKPLLGCRPRSLVSTDLRPFRNQGPAQRAVCTEHTQSWQRLVHVWTWSLFFLVLTLSKSAVVEIFSDKLCKSLIFEVCPMYLDILSNFQHTRVAEVTRRPEWPSPKSLDSDKKFKP